MRLFMAALFVALLSMPARAADRISVTQYGIVASTLPWAVALDRGFLKKEGVDVDGFIGANGGGTAVRNMMASGMPFGEVAMTAAIAGIRSGLKLKIIYGGVNNTGDANWMVRKDSPLKSLADLKGRKVGYDSPQGATEMYIHMILHKAGLDKDVATIVTGGSGPGIAALDAGGLDAVPYPNAMVPGKDHVLFEITQYFPNMVWTVGVTTEDYAKSHPDVLRKLIQARRDGVDFIYAHPDEASKIYANVWNVDESVAHQVVTDAIKKNYWSRGKFNAAGVQAIADGMRLMGQLDSSIDLEHVIDKSFLPPDQR